MLNITKNMTHSCILLIFILDIRLSIHTDQILTAYSCIPSFVSQAKKNSQQLAVIMHVFQTITNNTCKS